MLSIEMQLFRGELQTNVDELVKSRSNVWIPACAGMTIFVTN
jgi:hypothetical protein